MDSMYKLGLILLSVLFFTGKGICQESNFGNWLIFIGNKKLKNNWNWHHEVQYRNYDVVGDLEQLLLRTGIGYNVSTNANALFGYGYIRSENYVNSSNKVNINEHRIFQQFILKQKLKNSRIQHRYRFEQRFIEDDFKLRFRYFLGMNFPIWNHEIRELYLSIYNELFINTENTIFDRNRLYGGLGYKLNSKMRLELGYMTQLYTASSRDQLNIVCFYNW